MVRRLRFSIDDTKARRFTLTNEMYVYIYISTHHEFSHIKEESRLRLLENRVLRKILGPEVQ